MKTIDEYAADLAARDHRDADVHALTLIRCLDYNSTLNDAQRMAQVRVILAAIERAGEIRAAELQALIDAARAR